MKKNLALLVLSTTAAANAFAFLGVGDVVIVASNPAQELLWSAKELPKWIEMIDTAKQQVNQAQEMIDLVGHPEKFAGSLIDAAMPMLAATKAANAIKSSVETIDFAENSWKLYKGAEKTAKDTLAVAQNFDAFGQTLLRDKTRYLGMVKEKALRERVKSIVKKKHEIDTEELAYQERMIEKLRHAGTQSEIAFNQAALAASKQRMDLLAGRVAQAETELQAFVADAQLELRKDVEQVQEKAEAEQTELRRRVKEAVEHASGNLSLKTL